MKSSLFRTLTACACALALAGCAATPEPVHLYGTPAPVERAERTITITPHTRYVNVEGGEIIRFVTPRGEFGWHFNVAPGVVDDFRLNTVAPPGMLEQTVQAYVAPDPRYRPFP